MKEFYTENYNKFGFRTLGFSYKDMSEEEFQSVMDSLNEGN